MSHEGLGCDPAPSCKVCRASEASYRCSDCFSRGLLCKGCIVRSHVNHPLHRVQVKVNLVSVSLHVTDFDSQHWTGDFFTETSLFSLGSSYQLGHIIDDPCLLPSPPIQLTPFDTSGVHVMRLTYCFCNNNGQRESGNRRTQLLRVKWFPASWHRPGTAFTFRLLDFIHKLQTQSKINLYDFYVSLISITNSAGLKPPTVRHLQSYALPPWNLMPYIDE